MSDRLWVTWERQRRNRGLSRAVGAELLELVDERGRLLRYPALLLRTVGELRRRRPRVLFCQSPSIVLAALCVVLRPWLGHVLVVDAHNSGILPLEGRSRVLNALAHWSLQRADVVLVSNASLTRRLGSRVKCVLPVPDPLPELPPAATAGAAPPRGHAPPDSVLFVCSWHADEPVAEVLAAAAQFEPGAVRLWITGRPKGIDADAVPAAVELLGFVPDGCYVRALREASLVLALTTRQDSLNCAAYEAVAAGTPGILSDTQALREQFPGGFLFVRPEADAIARAVREGLAVRSRLVAALPASRRCVETRLRAGLDGLEAALGALQASRTP